MADKMLSITGVPNYQAKDWYWFGLVRNQGHTAGGELECNALESSQNHLPHPRSIEKLSSTKPVPGAKNVGDC